MQESVESLEQYSTENQNTFIYVILISFFFPLSYSGDWQRSFGSYLLLKIPMSDSFVPDCGPESHLSIFCVELFLRGKEKNKA